MEKKDFFQRDLLAGIEEIGRKFLPQKSGEELKGCLDKSLELIARQEEDDFDFVFFQDLEQQLHSEILRCSALEGLPAETLREIREEITVVLRALDFRYSAPEPEEAMRTDEDVFAEPEMIEPWWEDENGV